MKIRTIDEMEAVYYSQAGAEWIQKSDAPLLTTTAGVYNPVYGALVWAQLNLEANIWGCLPKYVWTRSGWRIMTARAQSQGIGTAEGGTLPESIKPTFVQVSTKPKTFAEVFEVSEIQQFEAAEAEDDAFGSIEQMRVIMGQDHKEMLNKMLLHDVALDAAAGQTGGGTPGDRSATSDLNNWNNYESLDRIVSSDSEEDAFGGSYDKWYDCYESDTFDRDSGETYDATVLHNSGVDRSISDDLIRKLESDARQAGANPTLWVMGHDTYREMQGLFSNYVRYNPLGEVAISVDVNGISTPEGIPVGINIPTLYNMPVIVSKDVPSDGIGRVFLLDTSDPEGFGVPRLGIQIAKPTQYFEAGMTAGNPFAINKLSNKGMYRTMGQVICRAFNTQAKLRDLKAA